MESTNDTNYAEDAVPTEAAEAPVAAEAHVEAQDEATEAEAVETAEDKDMADEAEDVQIDIPDASYDVLEKMKEAVVAKQREQRDRERDQDLNTIKGLVMKHGFKWSDIKVEKVVKNKVAPKYRNPNTGETWSGRGKAPLWIRDEADRTPFLI